MLFAPAGGDVCALPAFLSLDLMVVLALLWIHLQLTQLANLVENFLFKYIFLIILFFLDFLLG